MFMRRIQLVAIIFLAGMLAAGLYGCSSTSSSKTEESGLSQSVASGEHTEHADQTEPANHVNRSQHGDDSHDEKTDMGKMKAILAKLPDVDRESAEKQHFCPVSGEMLGTMGVPKKVDVNGQQVWICCNGCKDKLLGNPDEYLAKLKKE